MVECKETTYGFEFGDLAVERLFTHKGYVAVRLRSVATGKYVDVQVSPTGRSFHVKQGKDKRLRGPSL